jgi:enoyl-CoA hydratase/carnithine racemase
MTGYTTIRYEGDAGVATVMLARPEKRNAVSLDMFRELGEATDLAASDPEIRAVLLLGEGKSFSAGIDLTTLGELDPTGPAFHGFVRMAQRPYRNLATMAKPTIAAVQGHAIGAGFQLALACDLRLAATDVVFGMFEVRYGLVPDLGGNKPLAELVGPGRAKELVWTGRTVDAVEAEAIGLVNHVVALDALPKEAQTLAAELAAAPPIPVSLAKALINRSSEESLEAVMEREAEAQAACISSEDHREAVAAYLEKRPPKFRGR